MEDDEDLTPFWVQNTTNLRRADRVRHRLSSLFFNSELLLIILLVTAIFFLVFIVPSSLSFTSTSLFKPLSSVKKSWDSFNVVLVLVAVIFGFLSKNKNEDKNPNDYQITSPINRNEVQKSSPSTPNNRWFNELRNQNPTTPRTWYDSNVEKNSYINQNNTSGVGLRRTFSSYPDLCEVSPRWVSSQDHWRFYDDTNVDTYRFSDSNQINRRRSWREGGPSPEPADIKTIYEDPLESKRAPTSTLLQPLLPPALPSPQPDPPTLPSPPPAPEPVYEEKVKRESFHSVARKKERTRKKRDHNNNDSHHELEQNKFVMAPPTPPPPPPPPPPPLPRYAEPRSSKSDRKRGGTSATKEFLNSLYHKKKRKNRSKSVDNLDALIHTSETPPLHYQRPRSSTPPPPPPPPPPSLFHNLFTSKKARRKKNAPPPPPPPPPPPRGRMPRPSAPRPVKIRSFDSVEETNSGGESPLIPIPPPPPPPPFFKNHAWKFVVQGDYVRIDSTVSSRSGSPEPEDISSADATPTAEAGGGGERTAFAPSPLFCPSPDVNTKAENFISKFRAGLKLEKINSIKKSNLGPGVGLS